jgi:hypothetical protein
LSNSTGALVGETQQLHLVWAGKRTGSTVLFNAIRRILNCEYRALESGYLDDIRTITGADPRNVVLKAHSEPKATWFLDQQPRQTQVFISLRPAVEQARSLHRVFVRPDSGQSLSALLRDNLEIQNEVLKVPDSTRLFSFESDGNLWPQLDSLAKSLGVHRTWGRSIGDYVRLSKFFNRLQTYRLFGSSKDFDVMHHETHWHANHIGGWAPRALLVFDSEQLDLLREIDSSADRIRERSHA